jgi:4-amino-4-deoxy-L-arabinose transferase-like glycosyltransferase/putative flippase GtrA
MNGWPGILRHTAVKFAGVGVVNTLLTFFVIFSLKSFAGGGDVAANASGYAVGLACSFVLNKRWTFQHKGRLLPALARFLGVFAAAYLLNIVTVLALIRSGFNDYLAHVVGMPIYTLAFYFGCQRFGFAEQSIPPEGAARSLTDSTGNAPYRDGLALKSGAAMRWFIATALAAAVVLFYRLDALPLVLWDESRLANNALEMSLSGLSLVTTFDGVPDHWNTKPPLLIWLMSITIRLFGANEWGVRVPSVLAALATVAIIFTFCAVRLHKPVVGFLAVMVLFSTLGYTHSHGARAGDYDTLLTLWTTGYLLAGYLYLHGSQEGRIMWLTLCAAGIALAFMTKTIQGMIFLPALVLHAALHRRLSEIMRTPAIYVFGAAILLVCTGFYVVREWVDPGYFASAQDNDLLGRYATTIEKHFHGPLWYITNVRLFPWLVPGLLIAGYLAWRDHGERRRLSGFLGVMSVFYLAVISSAATKLRWYAMPLYPLIAMQVALGIDAVAERLASRQSGSQETLQRGVMVGCFMLGAVVVALNIAIFRHNEAALVRNELSGYGLFLRSPKIQNPDVKKFIVIHPGHFGNFVKKTYYVADVLFYVNALRAAGRLIEIQPPSAPIPAGFNLAVACVEAVPEWISKHVSSEPIATDGRCGLYRITGK